MLYVQLFLILKDSCTYKLVMSHGQTCDCEVNHLESDMLQ